MPLGFFGKSDDGMISREKLLEMINRQGPTDRIEVIDYLNNNQTQQVQVPGYNGRGRPVQIEREGQAMEPSFSQYYQTQTPAAEQQNARRDDKLYGQYRAEAVNAMTEANAAIEKASQAVSRVYVHSDPREQKAIENVERSLIEARSRAVDASKEFSHLEHDLKSELSKGTRSQYNAASRGDPRSVKAQLAKQSMAGQREVPTISASPDEAKPSRLEENRGKPRQDFRAAVDGTEKTKAPVVASEQVRVPPRFV